MAKHKIARRFDVDTTLLDDNHAGNVVQDFFFSLSASRWNLCNKR